VAPGAHEKTTSAEVEVKKAVKKKAAKKAKKQ
jgi:hypothetical protein